MDYRTSQNMKTVSAGYDAGLRSYMLTIYNYMAGALGVTGVVALLTANTPALLNAIYGTPLQWVVMLAPLGFILALNFGINKMSFSTAQIVFWAFSAVMGLSLSYIFLAYTGASIARAFFVTAGTFGAMSLYGYTTKKDLTGMGNFLVMGLIGILIASLVNIFLQSSGLQFAVSVLAVLIFTGLTAYDTQRLKHLYFQVSGNAEAAGKTAILGAVTLYLDFINLMIHLLHLFGQRR